MTYATNAGEQIAEMFSIGLLNAPNQRATVVLHYADDEEEEFILTIYHLLACGCKFESTLPPSLSGWCKDSKAGADRWTDGNSATITISDTYRNLLSVLLDEDHRRVKQLNVTAISYARDCWTGRGSEFVSEGRTC